MEASEQIGQAFRNVDGATDPQVLVNFLAAGLPLASRWLVRPALVAVAATAKAPALATQS